MTRERNRAGNHKDLGKSLGDRMRTRYESGTRNQRFCLNLHSSEFKLGSNTGWSEIFILTFPCGDRESVFSENTATVAWAPLESFPKAGNTIFFFTVGGFSFGYENQVQLGFWRVFLFSAHSYWASLPLVALSEQIASCLTQNWSHD